MTAHPNRELHLKDQPVVALADHIARTVQLVRRAPYLNRLISDELSDAGTEKSLARVHEMNLDLVDFYRQLLAMDGGKELIDTDPLFVCIAVLGACDFFVQAPQLFANVQSEVEDMEGLTARFQDFLVNLVLDGIRKR